jgi:hypothetical protein
MVGSGEGASCRFRAVDFLVCVLLVAPVYALPVRLVWTLPVHALADGGCVGSCGTGFVGCVWRWLHRFTRCWLRRRAYSPEDLLVAVPFYTLLVAPVYALPVRLVCAQPVWSI